MWFENLFKRDPQPDNALPLFDEAFLRRLERLNFRTAPSLRGTMMGERRSRKLRPAFDFSDHRPYTVGDDLRYVDWNTFGRTEELFVRLGEAPQSVNVHILLDVSSSMSWMLPDSPGISKWNSARQLAAALGYFGLSGGERLYLTVFDQTLGDSFGPTRGKRQIIRALKFIANLQPTPPAEEAFLTAAGKLAKRAHNEANLGQSLTTYARTHPQGGLVVLISDLLDTLGDAESHHQAADKLAAGLRYFTPPLWQVLVIHFLTEQELHPTFEEDLDLRDLETGESLPFHFDEATLTQYRLRVRRWNAELQSVCAQRGAIYAQVVAEWPLEKAVVPYLRQRGVV